MNNKLLSDIINPATGKTVIIPMDHLGIGTEPIKGYANGELAKQVIDGGANAILDHLGGIENLQRKGLQDKISTILHMSISCPIGTDPNSKMLVNSLKLAKTLGVKGVSMQVNIGHPDDGRMLQDLSRIAGECRDYNIPLLAMMYVRSKEDIKVNTKEQIAELNRNIGLSARLAEKMGAHIVKLPYTGNKESMKEIVDSLSIPVVVAGGSKDTEEKTLQMVADILEIGCAGVCMGRNSVERDNVTEFITVICKMVHENLPLDDAKKMLGIN